MSVESDRDFIPITPTSSSSRFGGSSSAGRVIHSDFIDLKDFIRRGSNYVLYSGTYDDGKTHQNIFVKKYEARMDDDDFEHEVIAHRAVWDTHFVRVCGASVEERHIVFRHPEGYKSIAPPIDVRTAELFLASLAPSLRDAVVYARDHNLRIAWCQLRPEWIMFKNDSVLLIDWETHNPGDDSEDEEARLLSDLSNPRSESFQRLIQEILQQRPESSMASSFASFETWVTVNGPRESEIITSRPNSDAISDMGTIALSDRDPDDRTFVRHRPVLVADDGLRADREMIIRSLENAGRTAGMNLTSRFMRDRPATALDAVKFLCKEIWPSLWNKDGVKLKGNTHANSFILEGVSFGEVPDPLNDRSVEVCVAFPIGVVHGSLRQMGFEAKVNARRSGSSSFAVDVSAVTRLRRDSAPPPRPVQVFTI